MLVPAFSAEPGLRRVYCFDGDGVTVPDIAPETYLAIGRGDGAICGPELVTIGWNAEGMVRIAQWAK